MWLLNDGHDFTGVFSLPSKGERSIHLNLVPKTGYFEMGLQAMQETHKMQKVNMSTGSTEQRTFGVPVLALTM